MTAETIAAFTRKIAASNRSELICVLYEIYFSYEEEAIHLLAADQKEDVAAYTKALRQCGQVIRHLKESLDFSYDVSYQLYALYDYAECCIAKAMYERKEITIQNAHHVMAGLQESFTELAKKDASAPMMGNAQQITAGLTYGRGRLNESMEGTELNRGFWA